ncbi:unnamed protein product [Kluyveromyces dobzhanskii CBS 2104]|uniref:WGS project CCBQ000000000 data, contig 00014 n=1 Tax=Kluyveromyces dobzhanskii CBS 2104 TaxID=1427455 RepID=A0A0A8L9H4_9SACH|nr:unnamed protein product [Kluyveromyces dobzhanskii CBS 2104]
MEAVEDSTVGSSTDALISPDYLHSTGSLVHKNFNELLQKQEFTSNLVQVPQISKDPSYSLNGLLNGIFDNSGEHLHDKNPPEDVARRGNTEYVGASNEFEDVQGKMYGGGAFNPILLRLYNMIQVFLLRHGLTLDFLTIFQRYINLLNEANVDALQDKYLLNLQNELSKGYEFSTILQDIITAFLLKPENVIMKLAYFQFKTEKLLLKRVFSSWQLKYSLSYNLSELEGIWKRYSKKRFLEQWKHTTNVKHGTWIKNANDFYSQRTTARFFDIWITRIDQLDTKSLVADNFFLDNTFANVKKRYERLTQTSTQVGKVCQKLLLARAFKSWKLRVCENHYNPASMHQYLLRKYLISWKRQHMHDVYLRELATFSERNFHLPPFFEKLVTNYQKKEFRQHELIKKSDLFTKQKYFRLIKLANDLVVTESKVRASNTDALQRCILSVWQKRLEERIRSYDLLVERKEKTLEIYFSAWKSKSDKYVTANSHYASHLERQVVKIIQLRSRVGQFNSRMKKAKCSKLFNTWRNKFELNLLAQEFDTLVLNRFYNIIKNKNRSLKDLGHVSARCYENDVSRRHFAFWQNRHKISLLAEQKADAFMKLRFITIIKRSINDARMKTRLSVELTKNNDKKLLENVCDKWKTRAESKRLSNLEILLDKFEDRRVSPMRQKYLLLWVNRLRFYNADCELVAKGNFDIVALRHAMSQWKVRFSTVQLLHAEAAEIHNSMTISNAFDAILKSLYKLHVQDSKLSLYSEEKQVKLLLKWTNKWSVKVMKLKRNEESVAMFRVRWNRANLRAIMGLWKEKASSNTDPSSGNELIGFSPSKDDITFQTPMKSPVSGIGTIPGSERVKRNKMNRIKNRFSRARGAIPSPIKTTRVLDSSVKARLSEPQSSTKETSESNGSDYLLTVNKRLAGKTRSISFNKIPETDLFGFPSPQPSEDPDPDRLKVNLNFFEGDSLTEGDDSPTRRRVRPIQ